MRDQIRTIDSRYSYMHYTCSGVTVTECQCKRVKRYAFPNNWDKVNHFSALITGMSFFKLKSPKTQCVLKTSFSERSSARHLQSDKLVFQELAPREPLVQILAERRISICSRTWLSKTAAAFPLTTERTTMSSLVCKSRNASLSAAVRLLFVELADCCSQLWGCRAV